MASAQLSKLVHSAGTRLFIPAVLYVLQRKRHFWRLDTKSLTLFQNESGAKFYRVRQPACPALVSADGPRRLAQVQTDRRPLTSDRQSKLQTLWLGEKY